MWSPRTGWTEAKYCLESNGLKPIKLGAKEGLALINGTQLITALGAEVIFLLALTFFSFLPLFPCVGGREV